MFTLKNKFPSSFPMLLIPVDIPILLLVRNFEGRRLAKFLKRKTNIWKMLKPTLTRMPKIPVFSNVGSTEIRLEKTKPLFRHTQGDVPTQNTHTQTHTHLFRSCSEWGTLGFPLPKADTCFQAHVAIFPVFEVLMVTVTSVSEQVTQRLRGICGGSHEQWFKVQSGVSTCLQGKRFRCGERKRAWPYNIGIELSIGLENMKEKPFQNSWWTKHWYHCS